MKIRLIAPNARGVASLRDQSPPAQQIKKKNYPELVLIYVACCTCYFCCALHVFFLLFLIKIINFLWKARMEYRVALQILW